MKKLTILTTSILTANLLFGQLYNKIDTSFFSEALQEEKMVDIYFPPGYNENPDMCYPVIYYLHGWFGDQNTMGSEMMAWTQSLINNGTIEPVIMVGADNSPEPFTGSMYTNSILWGNYEDYMVTDLINWIESSFRAVPSKNYRALLGHSMGGYGAFRYGILHKDKFKVLASTAAAVINLTDEYLENGRQKVMLQNQPGPPFFYDYNSTGSSTMGLFLFCGAFSPNYNTPQTYINPQIVEFAMDENGNWIDTILNKSRNNSISHLIHQLAPEDSVGILYGCGSGDEEIYPCHLAFQDSLDFLGLPYEFYDHDGGHIMPSGFKQRALIFIDSLLMSPTNYLTGIHRHDLRRAPLKLINYPNPFHKATTFQLEIPEDGNIKLSIWNHLGQEVKILFEGYKKAGIHGLILRVSDLRDGIYFCRLQVGNEIITKKIIKL